MFGIENYNSFILAILVFQLIPGAGTVTILNATARKGVATGMYTVLGTITGDFIYMLAAALGLSALLDAYPHILTVAQWIGVAYLCWIGVNLIRTPVGERSVDPDLQQRRSVYFRRGLAVSLTNPKVIAFFLAFFPLFLGAESGPGTLFILMAHVSLISLLFQTGLVLVGHSVASRLSKWRTARLWAARLAGLALIGIGAQLAVSNR